MNVLITEEQYYRLILINNINEQSMGGGFSPQFQSSELSKVNKEGLSHQVSSVLQLVTAFMPVVGPIVSAGLGLMDANKYWDDLACVTCGKQKPQTNKRLDEKVKEKEKSSAVEFEFDR
jgi:hypothetical protein